MKAVNNTYKYYAARGKKVPSLQNRPYSHGNFDLPKFINNSRPLFHNMYFQIDLDCNTDPTEFE